MSDKTPANVLIVDDEPALRELLTDALAASDIEVASAASGTEALQMAREKHPDLIVADVNLGDCTGLEVIDHLRTFAGDVPAVVITGYDTPAALNEAWQCRPVDLMTKPLDVTKLRATVREQIDRRRSLHRTTKRVQRLRQLAKQANIDRKDAVRHLQTTCAELSAAYKTLGNQMSLQQVAISYQRELMTATNDDDVFRALFSTFVHCSGPVAGVALVCDGGAEMKIVGRFGVPYPDKLRFCELLTQPIVDAAIVNAKCTLIDAGDQAETFDVAIQPFLAGVSVLSVPLIPSDGELIGTVVLYRKGEQPFTDPDMSLAELLAPATAIAVRRND